MRLDVFVPPSLIMNPFGVDVSITSPILRSALQDHSATIILAAANKREKEKRRKYQHNCTELGISFHPFVLESTGGLEKSV